MYFPTHYKFHIVRYEYFRLLFMNVFSIYFSVFIFLFVTRTIASLYKVLALMHIFTASIIPPIVFIRIVFFFCFLFFSLLNLIINKLHVPQITNYNDNLLCFGLRYYNVHYLFTPVVTYIN